VASSRPFLYRSTVDQQAHAKAGLVGVVVVTRAKDARPGGQPSDVDRELFTLFEVRAAAGPGRWGPHRLGVRFVVAERESQGALALSLHAEWGAERGARVRATEQERRAVRWAAHALFGGVHATACGYIIGWLHRGGPLSSS